jgi:hypothetical protein
MTDEQALYLLLAVVYLFECLIWVGRETVVFRAPWGRSFGILGAEGLPGTTRWGGLLAFPLPPLGTLLVTQQWPLSVSPQGALAFTAQAFNPGGRHEQEARLVRFEEIRTVGCEGRVVLVNGERFLAADSAALARHLAAYLGRLRRLPPPAREGAVREELARMLDAAALARRVEELRRRRCGVLLAANALFVHLFAVCPLVVAARGLSGTWAWLLAPALALQAAAVAGFFREHARLHPRDSAERWTAALSMALVPPAAIRAADHLGRSLAAGHHPLAAARVLCPREAFEEFAARVLRDLRHPLRPACPSPDPSAAAVESWHRAEALRAAEAFARRELGDGWSVPAEPARESPGSLSFCPRCFAQYTLDSGSCGDCGDLELVRFAAGGAPGAPAPGRGPRPAGTADPPSLGPEGAPAADTVSRDAAAPRPMSWGEGRRHLDTTLAS